MELKIQHWGNSAALRLNQMLLKQMGSSIGETLSVEIKGRSLILKPVKSSVTMESLLANCTKDNMRLSDEDREWLQDAPVGNEFS